MKLRILPFVCAVGTLAGIFSCHGSRAQNAPSWTSASVQSTNVQPLVGAATVDAAGNRYLLGSFANTATIGSVTLTSQGLQNGFLAKITPSGTVAWVQQLSSTGSNTPRDLVLDAAGNIYVTGNFSHSIILGNNVSLVGAPAGTPRASNICFVARYSPSGVAEWAQQSPAGLSTGVVGSGIGVDAAGSVYVTGISTNSVTLGSTTATLPATGTGTFLARLAGSTGTVQSVAGCLNYTAGTNIPYPKLAVASTGDAYVLNQFSRDVNLGSSLLTSRGNGDVLVAKYTAQGTLAWAQQYGGLGNETLGRGQVDGSGNLYVSGSFTGLAQFGSQYLASAGDSDGCLVKYSSQGTVQWAQAGGGPGADYWLGMALDATGAPYVTGSFSNTAQFGTASLTSLGDADMAVVAYTPQGLPRWAQQAGSATGAEFAYYIGLDASADVYIFGDFYGISSPNSTCTFGPFSLSSIGTITTGFVARLGNSVLATRTARPLNISLAPNPASDFVTLTGVPTGSVVTLIDGLGRMVRKTTLSATANVSVVALAPGLYTLQATDVQGRRYTGKVVVP